MQNFHHATIAGDLTGLQQLHTELGDRIFETCPIYYENSVHKFGTQSGNIMHLAICAGHQSTIDWLLGIAPRDAINHRDAYGMTPLHWIVNNSVSMYGANTRDFVNRLLARGADATIPGADGLTILDTANVIGYREEDVIDSINQATLRIPFQPQVASVSGIEDDAELPSAIQASLDLLENTQAQDALALVDAVLESEFYEESRVLNHQIMLAEEESLVELTRAISIQLEEEKDIQRQRGLAIAEEVLLSKICEESMESHNKKILEEIESSYKSLSTHPSKPPKDWVIVRIWLPKRMDLKSKQIKEYITAHEAALDTIGECNVGHASLQTSNLYISHWPREVVEKSILGKLHGNVDKENAKKGVRPCWIKKPEHDVYLEEGEVVISVFQKWHRYQQGLTKIPC